MTDTMASENIDLCSWDILYKKFVKYVIRWREVDVLCYIYLFV
jgi:hypothetical protein